MNDRNYMVICDPTSGGLTDKVNQAINGNYVDALGQWQPIGGIGFDQNIHQLCQAMVPR